MFAVQHSAEYDELFLKWFSVHEHQKRIGRLTRYVLLILGTITTILFAFIFWNWSLKRKVTQRYENTKYRESTMVKGAFEAEFYLKNMDVNGKWLYVTAALLKDQTGKIDGAIETWQDLTEYKQLEKQLIQSQKTEAIGTLAAGIAHDFNNILSAVIGYAELAQIDIPKDTSLHDYLEQIFSAGMRAKDLINQILTFSRQTEVSPKPIQLIGIKAIIKKPITMKDLATLIRKIFNDAPDLAPYDDKWA